MGRPPLPLGHAGDIRVYERNGGWQARAYVRDFDGRTRQINRSAKTKHAAKQALQAAVKNRYVGQSGEVTPETKVVVCR